MGGFLRLTYLFGVLVVHIDIAGSGIEIAHSFSAKADRLQQGILESSRISSFNTAYLQFLKKDQKLVVTKGG